MRFWAILEALLTWNVQQFIFHSETFGFPFWKGIFLSDSFLKKLFGEGGGGGGGGGVVVYWMEKNLLSDISSHYYNVRLALVVNAKLTGSQYWKILCIKHEIKYQLTLENLYCTATFSYQLHRLMTVDCLPGKK